MLPKREGDQLTQSGVRSVGKARLDASTRRQRLLTLFGRAATVFGPVAALLAVEGNLGSASDVAWGLVISLVFLACLLSSFAAIRNELLPLGVPVAAARGAAIGLVAVS